jgi:hypothetical protein
MHPRSDYSPEAELSRMSVADLSTAHATRLQSFYDWLTEEEAKIKELKEKLQEALNLRFGTNRSHGTFWHTTSPGLSVKVEVPKVVEWDQPKMKSLWKDIATKWHGDPDEYIDTRYFVPENRYKAWPSGLKQEFDAARTVKVGKPKFTFVTIR